MSTFSNCGKAERTNTGSFDCDEARKIPKKLILGGKVFAPNETVSEATYKAALIAATKLPYWDPNKLFVIHDILDPQDKTEANKEGAVGDGPKHVLFEGRPAFEYAVEIGQDLYKRLRKFNKRRIPIITPDDTDKHWGVNDDGGNFYGPKALFFITGNTQETSSAPVSAKITISYVSAKEYHDEAAYVICALKDDEPKGLLDAVVKKVSNAANVYKIDLKIATPQVGVFINAAKKYQVELVNAALWVAKTGATYSNALAITSVAYDAALECFTVTFDNAAYGALPANTPITLYLVDPAALEAADVTELESVAAEFIK